MTANQRGSDDFTSRRASERSVHALDEVIIELEERVTELQQQLANSDEAVRSAFSSGLAFNVSRKLSALARSTDTTLVPERAYACHFAARTLGGPIGKHDRPDVEILVRALDALVDEAKDRMQEEVELGVALEDSELEREALNETVGAMTEELAALLGETEDDHEDDHATDRDARWHRLLGRVCASVPPPKCAVPGCTDVARPLPRRSDLPEPWRLVGGRWPAALCNEHTAVRFEMFQEAVAEADIASVRPIHVALVPVPALAYLAPPPHALRDPPRRTRLQRVVPDDE